MPFQAVPNVALVTVNGRVDGQETINDHHFEITGGSITSINLAELVAAMAAWAIGTLAPLLSDDWALERLVGVDLTTATGPRRETSAPQVGGVSGEANPNNVAACVSLRTDGRGRSFRGRNYVPGIPGSVVTLNTLDSGFIASLTTAYFDLVGPGTFLAGWQYVIVSRITAGAPRAEGLAIPVTDITMVGNSVRSMRSREVGQGA